MASALELFTGVLFEDDLRSTWQTASSSERAQILAESGLDDLSSDDLSEALLLLVDELPADQAVAISETVPGSAPSSTDPLSLLDHYVDSIAVPLQSEALDEFDEIAPPDGFEPESVHQDPTYEIDLGEEFDIDLVDDTEQLELTSDDSTVIDQFEADTHEIPIDETHELEHLEFEDDDIDDDFDIGE
ncbi:MAG: hypothetical protein ACC652_06275 [Acidimicrobiales bacterium]